MVPGPHDKAGTSTEESGEEVKPDSDEAKEDTETGSDYREKSGNSHKVIDKIFRTEGDQLFNASVNRNIEKETKEEEEAENRAKIHKTFSSDKGRFQ